MNFDANFISLVRKPPGETIANREFTQVNVHLALMARDGVDIRSTVVQFVNLFFLDTID
jgi:hypothetical protein